MHGIQVTTRECGGSMRGRQRTVKDGWEGEEAVGQLATKTERSPEAS